MNPEAIADVIVSTVQRSIAPILGRLDTLERQAATVPERLAAIETRELPPGPIGPAGERGADGAPGAPGKDGVGFDDLSVDFDGDRTIALKFSRDGVTKSYPITIPFLRYQGVWQNDYAYVIGDIVTSGGAAWHCQKPTTLRPGDSVDAWRLMVRKGRDGKDAGR